VISPAIAAVGAWTWHPHLLVWVAVAVIGGGVALIHRRLLRTDTHAAPWPRVRIRRFVGALVVTLVALGWPLGDLAAHWSLSALVLQRCLLVLAVASLILGGLPDDVIRWVTRPAPVDAVLLRVLRPPAAVIVVTVVLVGSMAPGLVVAQSNSVAARGALDFVVVCAGIVLWLPVIGRIPGIARPRPMIRAVYLVAQAVVPVFLSFIFILAPRPLYPVFVHSRSVLGLSPLGDQQVAGFVSKLSFLFTLLAVAGAVLARAPDSDDDLGPEDPLVWADIERHFERADRRGGSAAEPLVAPGVVPPGAEAGGPVPPVDHGSDNPGDAEFGHDQDTSPD
jgi:putative membrane protein